MLLEIKNLNKTFKNTTILKNFNLTVATGECLTIVGASGAGKTTLLRLINRLEEADSGAITVDGLSLCTTNEMGTISYAKGKALREYHNKVGMVFQNFNLFPNKTVLENCLLAPLVQKMLTPAEAEAKALELLKKVGLIDKKDVYPNTLSGGQMQRVAIARAMMLNPKILCFDEPTSALDEASSRAIGEMIKEIAVEGMAVLIVTHDLTFAEQVSTRSIDSASFI